MKEYIKNIVAESLGDEVNLDREWNRLVSGVVKQDRTSLVLQKKRLASVRQWMGYAAAMLIGLCLSSSLFLLADNKPVAQARSYKLVTDKGEKSFLELPDGSKVWLNSCTTIKYSSDYGKSDRDIFLNGEAYFEVAKDTDLPFVVKTSSLNVTAVGTAFDVSAYDDDSQLITTVFSGKVAVQPTLTKQQILLETNQVAIYDKSRNRIETRSYNKQLYAQWRNGALSFEMMPLKEITKLLERNYNVVFCYDNQKIKQLKFSGSFRNSEALSEILKIIKTNISIDYKIDNDTITIK